MVEYPEYDEDPVATRVVGVQINLEPRDADNAVPITEDEPQDALEQIVPGPNGIPYVGFPCPKCDSTLAGRLIDVMSPCWRCPQCGETLNPSEAGPSMDRLIDGFIYLGEGRTKDEPELALALASEVLFVDSSVGAAHNIAAIVYDEKGDTEKALQHFRLAVDFAPDKARYHYGYGVALLKRKDADIARREFERALELFPDYLFALNNLVECYRLSKDWVAATIGAFRMLNVDPDGQFGEIAAAQLALIARDLTINASPVPRRSLWTQLTGKLTQSRTNQIWNRLRGNSYGHVESLREAFELQEQGEYRNAADIFRMLQSLLPVNSAGSCLMCECEATCWLMLDSHLGAYRLSQRARGGMPCVSALIPLPELSEGPSLSADVIRVYARLIERLFGVRCLSGFNVTEKLRSGRVRKHLEFLVKDEEKPYLIRRAGHILRITTPTAKNEEHRISQESYLAFNEL